MAKQLLVLGCSQRKRDIPGLLPAIDRYDGPPYRVLRAYLREHEWPRDLSIAVLSAEYGLVGGLTRIVDYDKRMTPIIAESKRETSCKTLISWAQGHETVSLALGKDYLPALRPALEGELQSKTRVLEGPIGMKQSQVKGLLESTNAPKRRMPALVAGTGRLSYFLPDWDDLLDEDFDFENDRFSAASRAERGDKHCCRLMQPERMCDGVLVSLAQHIAGKGPLRKFEGTQNSALAPINLRDQFGLVHDQALFGDCGAFSYVNEEHPAISVEQAVALYDLYGFDYGASVDHIPVHQIAQGSSKKELTQTEREARVSITKANAATFISEAHKRKTGFIPVGTIQGLKPEDFPLTAAHYHELGYRHLAVGGLVPLPDSAIEEIVTALMKKVEQLNPRPWVHLFGIFRPNLQAKFRDLKVDSFDSATYFRKAWLRSDQNYLASNGKWYAAIRVPMTSDARTLKRLQESGQDVHRLQAQESLVLQLLSNYDSGKASLPEVLEAVLTYDEQLTRSSDSRSLRDKYTETLRDRPWTKCKCPFCTKHGIHVLIFRGCNRNKRRGAHNTLMLYNAVGVPNAKQ